MFDQQLNNFLPVHDYSAGFWARVGPQWGGILGWLGVKTKWVVQQRVNKFDVSHGRGPEGNRNYIVTGKAKEIVTRLSRSE